MFDSFSNKLQMTVEWSAVSAITQHLAAKGKDIGRNADQESHTFNVDINFSSNDDCTNKSSKGLKQ